MAKEEKMLLHDLINHLNKTVLQDETIVRYAQRYDFDQLNSIIVNVIKHTVNGRNYCFYEFENFNDIEPDDSSMVSEPQPDLFDIGEISDYVLPIRSSGSLFEDERQCKSKLNAYDIERVTDTIFRNFVVCAKKYYKYDFHALQYIRQLLLHMNREKEADEVESLIKQLIAKNNYISGNYVEKQEINNYGKGK